MLRTTTLIRSADPSVKAEPDDHFPALAPSDVEMGDLSKIFRGSVLITASQGKESMICYS